MEYFEMSNYGLTAANGTARPALTTVRRWNDGVRRHTLYTVCGTQQDGWGFYNDPGTSDARTGLLNLVNSVLTAGGLPTVNALPADGANTASLGLASPDTVVGNRVNSNLFNWVPISYPASFPGAPALLDNSWQPNNISINDSITVGANQLISLIKNTPGTFALCGMSQGAVVISQVLRALLPGGTIANRYNDCIGAVAFGNPCRKQGASFPGGTATANTAGLFSQSTGKVTGLSRVNLPPWWWEMSTPGDLFSDAPMAAAGGAAGTVATQIGNVIGNFKGLGLDPVAQIGNLVRLVLTATGPLITAARTSSGTAALRALGLWLRDLGLFAAMRATPGQLNFQQQVVSALTTGLGKGLVKGLFKLTDAELADNLLAGNYPYGNPHMFYGVWKPPTLPAGLAGVNASSTYVDVAVAYLNAQAAAIAPR